MNGLSLRLCMLFAAVASVSAAELTSVDLIPQTDWRYFYNSLGIDDLDFNAALENSGFYVDWTSASFSEPTVAGVAWQTGTLPIGQRNVLVDWPTELATTLDLPTDSDRRRTVFLRRTFSLPEDVSGPLGVEFFFESGATVYLDGQELAREYCCVEQYREEPIERAPNYLDFATGRHGDGLGQVKLDNLAAGEHTLAVSVHDSDAYNPQQRFRTGFDFRLYSPGNARPWTNQEYRGNWDAPENWLFGLPGPDDFAIFPRRGSDDITNDQLVSLAGLQLTGKLIHGDGAISLGSENQTGTLNATGESNQIENEFRLANDVEFLVDVNSILYLEGNVELNSHAISKTGGGALRIRNAGESAAAGVLQLREGSLLALGSQNSFRGDVISSGGVIEIEGESVLSISGDVSAPVVMSLTNQSNQAALVGGGDLSIENLSIELPNTRGIFQPIDGRTFTLFPDWESLTIQGVDLPNIGLATWDTSRLAEGILSIINTERAACDFDASGLCDLTDMEQLLADVADGLNDPRSDINNDGQVNLDDRDEWLIVAGASIGVSPFLLGDVNLDGSVNASDLMMIGLNWQSTSFGWGNGDFNGDGIVNATDLNELGKNWQREVTRLPANPANAASTVPEPMSYLLLAFGGFGILNVVRRLPRSTVAFILLILAALIFGRGQLPTSTHVKCLTGEAA